MRKNDFSLAVTALLLLIPIMSFPSYKLTWDCNGMDKCDSVGKTVLKIIEPGKRGTECFWDFSKIEKSGESSTEYRNNASNISEYENHRNNCYIYRNDSLFLSGFFEAGISVEYLVPEMVMRYPIQYGDSAATFFYGEGSFGKRLHIRNAGWSYVCADATGSAILPEGDTLRNIIRTHYRRIGTTSVSANFKRSFWHTNDSSLFSQDSINYWLRNDSILHHIEIWRWYAEGFRYPVFERRDYTITKYGVPIDSMSLSFYTSPETQMFDLSYDPENETERNSLYDNLQYPLLFGKYRGNPPGRQNRPQYGNSIMDDRTDYNVACTVNNSSGTSVLTIKYMLPDGGNADISIFSASGKLMWCKENVGSKGMNSIDVPLSGYIDGEYLVTVTINGETYSEKVLKL